MVNYLLYNKLCILGRNDADLTSEPKNNPSIQIKIVRNIAIVFLCMFILLYVVYYISMQSMLLQRENDNISSHAQLAESILESSVNYLPNVTRDWSSWDLTYDFVEGKYDEYIENNLYDYPYQLYRINFTTILDTKHERIYEQFFDFNCLEFMKKYPDLSELYEILGPITVDSFKSDEELNLTDATQIGTAGFVHHKGIVYYVSSYPIIHSDETGPCVGSFIFGRIIDEKEINYLTANSDISFSVVSLENTGLTDDEVKTLHSERKLVKTYDDQIVSYAAMDDIFGNKNLAVAFSSPRNLYQDGNKFIGITIGVIALCCCLVLIIILLQLNRIIVKPLGALVNEVNEIDLKNVCSALVPKGKIRELDNLTTAINDMLNRIKRSRDTIEKKNEELFFRATFDILTGLSNRFRALTLLDEEITKAKQNLNRISIFYFDLDRFKFINDTLGHSSGDGLISALSDRLKLTFGNDSIIARMGGDEFLIISNTIHEPAEIYFFAEKIFSVFKQPFIIKQRSIQIGVSIGSSTYPEDGQDAETLIKNAEIAMFRAKDMGAGLYVPYQRELHAAMQQRIFIENKLRSAVNDNCSEFSAYFQPKLLSATGEIISCEALMRWISPEGMISPGEFLPQAEESGLIIPLSWWMIRECCKQAKTFTESGINCTVAINVSAQVLLHDDFIPVLTTAVETYGIAYSKLDIEIVEQTLVNDLEKVNNIIKSLHVLGLEISVDDFGTGYSSLSYLNKMSVDRIKIDRTFISRINSSEEERAIVRAILAMAKSLHMVVTAEGVEDKEQYKFLKEALCEEIQGFLISKPLPASEFIEFVKRWNPDEYKKL